MVSLSGLAVGLPVLEGSGGGPRGPDEIGRPGQRAAFPAVGGRLGSGPRRRHL